METNSQLMRLGLFDSRVPRYTSYPTAPNFTSAVDADTAGRWITAIPDGAAVSLYVHVPFCRRLCLFCACRTQGTQSNAPVLAYVETLKREIALLGARLPAGVRLSRLHWGGGTPTLLPPEAIESLAEAIHAILPPAEDWEFSVEIDPNEIDEPRLDALARAGMNRASIGVQDFDPMIQTVIGRHQPFDLTRRAADMIRARGVGSLNADILYGLPHQTLDRIAASVEMLLALSPDRVALYGYAHVPWMARRQQLIPSDALPTPPERLRLFESASAIFTSNGYDTIGIDHFARPTDSLSKAAKAGKLRRNFQGYTDDPAETLIGLGASSIARFPQGYAQSHASTSAYVRAVSDGVLPVARGHVFSAEDLVRGRMIEMLMCDFRIDRAAILAERPGSEALVDRLFGSARETFGDYVQLTARGLEVPAPGWPLIRMMARTFDAYEMAKTGHSHAI